VLHPVNRRIRCNVPDVQGHRLDLLTQYWVKLTGRTVDLHRTPWLDGPSGLPSNIGDEWVDGFTASIGARSEKDATSGLVQDIAALDGDGFSAALLAPKVVEFYEHTSEWRLEVWSRWSAPFRPLGAALSGLFSKRLQQLNLPLDPLEVSRGMTSEVTRVVTTDGSWIGTAWQRTLRATEQTVFGGFYGVVSLPSEKRPSIRVVFPLPNGRLSVFLRPENAPRGGLRLVSEGSRWGEVGAYLVVAEGDRGWTRRVPLPEVFDVFVDEEGTLRANHVLRLYRWEVIRFHYRLQPDPQ
jgi:hypothetical protein